MDDFYADLKLKMDYDSFCKLPRIPGYKSEYFNGETVLIPRPKAVRMTYDLTRLLQHNPVTPQKKTLEIRELESDDWDFLVVPMLSAFAYIQPFKTMEKQGANLSMAECLTRTRKGQYGELIFEASFVARASGRVIGAGITTIVEDVPHLTWLFVESFSQRLGLGTYLFQNVASKLKPNWHSLQSTARSDNVGALLWHWRVGFQITEAMGRV